MLPRALSPLNQQLPADAAAPLSRLFQEGIVCLSLACGLTRRRHGMDRGLVFAAQFRASDAAWLLSAFGQQGAEAESLAQIEGSDERARHRLRSCRSSL
jgi:hypothetical protein